MLKSFNNFLEFSIYIITKIDNKELQYIFANILQNSFIAMFLKLVLQKSFAVSITTIIKKNIIIVIKVSFIVIGTTSKLFVIKFLIDLSSKLNIEYRFCNYIYTKVFVFLSKYIALKKRYLNSNVDLTIFN